MGITETQRKILEAGKREFLAKGYERASLRAIVKEAGFTLGAFYGYYDGKAQLFEALAAPADVLAERFKAAQDAHFDLIPQGRADQSLALSEGYLREFVDYIYDNFDAFKLVLCRAEGTRYADYVHGLVELEVKQTERYFDALRAAGKLKGAVSHDLLHMITSAYFAAVFETVAHDMPRERALAYIGELSRFFGSGWAGLLAFS